MAKPQHKVCSINIRTLVLLDQRLFILNDKAYTVFLAALESPVENMGLKALFKSKSSWEK